MSDRLEPPTGVTGGDVAYAALKGAVGALPVAGSILAEFFGLVVTPPLARRLEAWMSEVAGTLKILQDRAAVSWPKLAEDEGFLSTLVQATEAARRTHEREKLDVLRNAIANTALPGRPEDSRRAMFVRWADEFTVLHIQVLGVCQDPEGWFTSRGEPSPFKARPIGSVLVPAKRLAWEVLPEAYPELAGQEELVTVVMDELNGRNLFRRPVRWDAALDGAKLSGLGRDFVRFLSEPAELSSEHRA